MGVKGNIKLIFEYLKLNIKKEWQYKSAFIMQIVAMVLNDAFFIIQWLMIFGFLDGGIENGTIGGYGFKEVMLLWSMNAGSYGISHLFFGGAWNIKKLVYDAGLDVYFTQPKNMLINVCCSSTNISAIGDIIYSFIVLIIIKAEWYWFLLIIPVMIISGCMYVAVYVVYVSLCFYVKGGDALGHAVESTITKVCNYPPTIYSNVVKFIMATFIPIMFYCFVPVENIFLNFNIWYTLIYILVATLWIILAFICFNMGVKKYNSGSVMGGRM